MSFKLNFVVVLISLVYFSKSQILICELPPVALNFCNSTYLNTPITFDPKLTNFTKIDKDVEKIFESTINSINNSTNIRSGGSETVCSFLYKKVLCTRFFDACFFSPLLKAKPCVELCQYLVADCSFNQTEIEYCGTVKLPKPEWGKNLCVLGKSWRFLILLGDGSNPIVQNANIVIFFILGIMASSLICLINVLWENRHWIKNFTNK
jgi:hypothetical protein